MLKDFEKTDHYIVNITINEARMLDYLLTGTISDEQTYRRIIFNKDLKREIGRVIIKQSEEDSVSPIEINNEEFDILLAIVPITFKFGESGDVGKSLKEKLYRILIEGNDGTEPVKTNKELFIGE